MKIISCAPDSRFMSALKVKVQRPGIFTSDEGRDGTTKYPITYTQDEETPGQIDTGPIVLEKWGFPDHHRHFKVDLRAHRIHGNDLVLVGHGARRTMLFAHRGLLWRRLMAKEVRGWDHMKTDKAWHTLPNVTKRSGSIVWGRVSGEKHYATAWLSWLIVPVSNPDVITLLPFVSADEHFKDDVKYQESMVVLLQLRKEHEEMMTQCRASNA